MAKRKDKKIESSPNEKNKTLKKVEDEAAQAHNGDINGDDSEEEADEVDATISQIVNGTLEEKKKKTTTKKTKKKRGEKENDVKACDCAFPMNRIRRIVKSEGSSAHIAQDSIFIINKASEKFLELFCKEAYACATSDKKKHVEYKHLSSVVSKRKRFDFLSDFVPEKVKAGDALAEMSSAET